MDPALVGARARLYALLARCVLEGPTDAVRDAVAALPALAEPWPPGDPDACAALHHAVLGMGTFPYESVFLGEQGRLGGPVAAAVADDLAASGLPEVPVDVEPDHLGVALRNLAWLSAAEADALEDGRTDAVARIRALARHFLDTHLLRWLPALAVAARGASPWHDAVLGMALELSAGHRSEIPGDPPPWDLGEPGDPLDDPATGLKRLAAWLLVPRNAGLLVTARAIDRWAAAIEVPRGFGGRLQTLESLLFGAVDHGRLPALLAAMEGDLEAAAAAHADLAALGVPTAPWRARLAATRRVLARLGDAAG